MSALRGPSGQSRIENNTHASSLPLPQAHTMHAATGLQGSSSIDRPLDLDDDVRPCPGPAHSKTHVASVKPHGHMRVRARLAKANPSCALSCRSSVVSTIDSQCRNLARR